MGFIVYVTQDLCRISGHNGIVRHIFCDYGACADDRVISDGNAGKYHAVAAEPYIIANSNGTSIDIIGSSGGHIHGMIYRIQTSLWSHQAVVSDGNGSSIQHDTLEVGKKVFPYMDIEAIVAVERWLDENIVITASEQFL